MKQKYSLKVFSKTKLACKQHENKFFLPAQFIWEMFRSKVGNKSLHLFFNWGWSRAGPGRPAGFFQSPGLSRAGLTRSGPGRVRVGLFSGQPEIGPARPRAGPSSGRGLLARAGPSQKARGLARAF